MLQNRLGMHPSPQLDLADDLLKVQLELLASMEDLEARSASPSFPLRLKQAWQASRATVAQLQRALAETQEALASQEKTCDNKLRAL